jgi:hypothetical protein
MNREIKFRCWDRVKFLTDEYFFIQAGRPYKHLEFEGWDVVENGIIQQFTGLKDSYGKEIYDGDLIKMEDGLYGPYRVFWDDKRGGWCSCCYSDSELISTYKTIEVVGHIFDGTEYEGNQ